MKLTFSTSVKKNDLIIVPLFEDGIIDKLLPKELAGLKRALKNEKQFEGKVDQLFAVTPLSEKLPLRALFVGCGKEKDTNGAIVRNAAAEGIKFARKHQAGSVSIYVQKSFEKHLQALAEGFVLANYNPAKYQTGENKKKHEKMEVKAVEIVTAKKDAAVVQKGQRIAEAVNSARDLVNAPHNFKNGEMLAREAQRIGKENRLKVTILNKKQIEKLGMGAFLGVNKGSVTEAKLVLMEHKGAKGKPVVLVGKGITFDSGGYNLKSGPWLADMKMDMSGAAVVMSVLGLCGKLGIKRHVIGVAPITDNLIDKEAQKVSDIVTTYSGKTVEVNNTDAEGRLILCDALAYAIDTFKPEMIVDVATLTGACMMALGEQYAGLFGNHRPLIDRLRKSGEETDELAWPMPIHPDHAKEMKSRIADLQNVNYGNEGKAGASTAAAFLQEFVGDTRWAHLDIAGTAFVKHPKKYESPMATGYGVRLLINFLEHLKGEQKTA